MEMKLIITRKALYLALFWKLGLWNTEMAFRSMKHEIHYIYPWFAGFIPDEFANLCVIYTGLEKMETVTPFSIFNSIYFNGTIWKSFCSDRPQMRKSSDSASTEIPVLFLHE